MVFSSLLFIFAFLPLTILAYYLVPVRFRNVVLLAGSGLFYAWGAPRFLFVLLASCLLDFAVVRFMQRAEGSDRRRWVILSISYNLGLLLYFKYANFFVEEMNGLLALGGFTGVHWVQIALPIGISFFTFHKISYLVDVYRRIVPPAPTPVQYILYVILFPQLIAGPIIRYHDVSDQIRSRSYPTDRMLSGLWRFGKGMAKKVLIANTLAEAADKAFAVGAGDLTCQAAWLGVLCYAFQIYYDFSGYSDMAIGLGRMFGFEFLENFNRPYLARSFTDFWRRWHISLSNFMREYLYIPLGGNRVAPWRAYLNLWIVFFLSGFWHGASWNFIVWGCFHGFFLSVDKLFGSRRLEKIPAWVSMPLTFGLVNLSWVFFRAETLQGSLRFIKDLFTVGGTVDASALIVTPRIVWVFIIAVLAVWIPALPAWQRFEQRVLDPQGGDTWRLIRAGAALVLLFFSASALATGNFNPFIYFRF